LLARRGLAVTLYDKRPDPRNTLPDSGRSINLALAARGIRALEQAGIMQRVWPLSIPMRGRMIHELTGQPKLLPYGQRAHEVIYPVGRAPLNRLLIEEAARHANVTLRFGHACVAVRPQENVLTLRHGGSEYETALSATIAADGGGSAVRASLTAAGLI